MGANGAPQAFPYAAKGAQPAQRIKAPGGALRQSKAATGRGVSGA